MIRDSSDEEEDEEEEEEEDLAELHLHVDIWQVVLPEWPPVSTSFLKLRYKPPQVNTSQIHLL